MLCYKYRFKWWRWHNIGSADFGNTGRFGLSRHQEGHGARDQRADKFCQRLKRLGSIEKKKTLFRWTFTKSIGMKKHCFLDHDTTVWAHNVHE